MNLSFVSVALGTLLALGHAAAQDCEVTAYEGVVEGAGADRQRVTVEGDLFAGPGADSPVSDRCVVALPEGAVMMPGLVDGHAHLLGIGLREMTLNLEGVAGVAELQDRLRDAAAEQPRGPIVGRGWIETGWPEGRMPTRDDLDAAISDRPVILTRADGHALIANSAALDAAKVRDDTADTEGGRIMRDGDGRATGLLIDAAMGLVDDQAPPLTAARRREALKLGANLYAARGWTAMHNMSVDAEDVTILTDLARRGELPIRVYSYVTPEALAQVEPGCDVTGLSCVQGVKLYVDGALGSRGALLAQPYADEPDTVGLQLVSEDRAKELFDEATAKEMQVTTHAIGDEGNHLVLEWYADAMPEGARWRIEHAQILNPKDVKRFSQQGVIASMQPSHAIGDLHFAPARLGDQRLDGAYAWASLRGSGAVVVGGSDAPVEVGDPRIELYAATERRDLKGYQGKDWRAREALSRGAALRIFTASAAYAIGEEDRLGRIESGYAADLSVFCGDPFGGPEAATPLFTMVGGRVVAGDPTASCAEKAAE